MVSLNVKLTSYITKSGEDYDWIESAIVITT